MRLHISAGGAASLPAQGSYAFTDDDRKHYECCYRVSPPPSENSIQQQASKQYGREIRAQLGLLCIRRQRGALDPGRHAAFAREAKAIVALAFRNGPIEDVHGGKPCPTCYGQPGYSRITDAEMKLIMKNAVNRVYALLRLKSGDPDGYAREIAYGERCAASWDEPEQRFGEQRNRNDT